MERRKRTVGINIRVTESEKKHIVRNAKRCRLSVSEYLRQLANGYEPKELPNARIFDLCWQIDALISEYDNRGDVKFKQYLAAMLDDLGRICSGQRALTETEVNANGCDQDMAGA